MKEQQCFRRIRSIFSLDYGIISRYIMIWCWCKDAEKHQLNRAESLEFMHIWRVDVCQRCHYK